MKSDRDALESSGETQIEVLKGLCDSLEKNFKRRHYDQANDLTKLVNLLSSGIDTVTEHLKTNQTNEIVEE